MAGLLGIRDDDKNAALARAWQAIAAEMTRQRQAGGGLLGDDWTSALSRMRPGSANVDPGMVATPPVDPGYAMPNADQGNLNQSPGQEVLGTLPAAFRRWQQQ